MSIQRSLGWAVAGIAIVLGGCNTNPSTGSKAYNQGKLGNGGFLFQCDDSVACERWSSSAEVFPDRIATGSNFTLRFVEKGQQGTSISLDRPDYPGVVVQVIGPYVGTGPAGFAGIKPGYGTVVGKDASGKIVDYATIKIVQPDALVVYDAAYHGDSPNKIESTEVKVGASVSFRTVGEQDLHPIAGALAVEWSSEDETIAAVESYTKGVVKIDGKKAGKTKLTATGAAMTKTIELEVKP